MDTDNITRYAFNTNERETGDDNDNDDDAAGAPFLDETWGIIGLDMVTNAGLFLFLSLRIMNYAFCSVWRFQFGECLSLSKL